MFLRHLELLQLNHLPLGALAVLLRTLLVVHGLLRILLSFPLHYLTQPRHQHTLNKYKKEMHKASRSAG